MKITNIYTLRDGGSRQVIATIDEEEVEFFVDNAIGSKSKGAFCSSLNSSREICMPNTDGTFEDIVSAFKNTKQFSEDIAVILKLASEYYQIEL